MQKKGVFDLSSKTSTQIDVYHPFLNKRNTIVCTNST